jgi:hypothetical protein
MRCLTHRRGFTLYPFGHIPYGRKAVAPVAPDGSPVRGRDAIQETVFSVAADAAAGRPWQRDWAAAVDRPWWPTMVRQLAMLSKWLGVDPELSDEVREERAADLRIDLLPLVEAEREISTAPGYRSRGRAVMRVLGEIRDAPDLLVRLLRAGHAAGLFGAALLHTGKGRPLRSVLRERRAEGDRTRARDPPRHGPVDSAPDRR